MKMRSTSSTMTFSFVSCAHSGDAANNVARQTATLDAQPIPHKLVDFILSPDRLSPEPRPGRPGHTILPWKRAILYELAATVLSALALRIFFCKAIQNAPQAPAKENPMDDITGLAAVVMLLGMPTAILAMYTFYRVRKLRTEERLAAIQRGVAV